ncbi:hypothetical protein C882_3548 [Caenispirillum salinarum AK4]|uniref:Uncharacterized protein n=1 Tax=Caenispirillum salinarum AK4 TaxID=1238182 RepID=K9H2J2_9PROT|nr:hypothetical protein C882_3548 [Caenispirillum salinarum AK4]
MVDNAIHPLSYNGPGFVDDEGGKGRGPRERTVGRLFDDP